MKAVNSSPKELYGIARGVELCLGNWCGKADFSVAPMDDFKVVLGLRKVNIRPMPYYDSVCLLEKGVTSLTTKTETDAPIKLFHRTGVIFNLL